MISPPQNTWFTKALAGKYLNLTWIGFEKTAHKKALSLYTNQI